MVSGKKYDQKVNLGFQCILCRPLTVATYPPPVQKRNLQFNSREGQNLKNWKFQDAPKNCGYTPKHLELGFVLEKMPFHALVICALQSSCGMKKKKITFTLPKLPKKVRIIFVNFWLHLEIFYVDQFLVAS